MQIKVGTRKSKLALIQANLAVAKIQEIFPEAICKILPIETSGDLIKDKNLYDIGGKALFLKEIEEQLLQGNIDIAVHSLKDVPGIVANGLTIEAVLERGDARDALVSKHYRTLEELPKYSKIGTCAPRRIAIINHIRPDLEIVQLRGNVETRFSKISQSIDGFDAVILAMAGLQRANLFDPDLCNPLSEEVMIPAAGQGTIGLEIRSNDIRMIDLCKKINHLPSWYLAEAERGFLNYLDANCKTPIAAYAQYEGENIVANYMLSDFEGTVMQYHTEYGFIEDAKVMGVRAAKVFASKA